MSTLHDKNDVGPVNELGRYRIGRSSIGACRCHFKARPAGKHLLCGRTSELVPGADEQDSRHLAGTDLAAFQRQSQTTRDARTFIGIVEYPLAQTKSVIAKTRDDVEMEMPDVVIAGGSPGRPAFLPNGRTDIHSQPGRVS